jgi:hypothetical protein
MHPDYRKQLFANHLLAGKVDRISMMWDMVVGYTMDPYLSPAMPGM